MHSNFGFRELSRVVLTVVGIILLLVFGARAASQASSVTAVGGQAKEAVAVFQLRADTLATLKPGSYPSGSLYIAAKAAVPSNITSQSVADSATKKRSPQSTIKAAIEKTRQSAMDASNKIAKATKSTTTVEEPYAPNNDIKTIDVK